jgi:hypothetical protein
MNAQKPPDILNKIADLVLAYRPKPKTKAAKERAKAAKKMVEEAAEEMARDEKEVGEYVREREASIRKGARRAGKRFRL